MPTVHRHTTTRPDADPSRDRWWRRPGWVLGRHYAEMILAMLVGMAVLFPLWTMATDGVQESGVLRRPDVELTVMATAMTVPMVAWMRVRGCRWRLVAEMALAMYLGFWLLFPALWAGALSETGAMVLGHVLMPLLMLAAMLLRRSEYAHCP